MNNEKIKILIATGIYPPDIGGPATYVKTLSEELPKFGYEIKIITYSDDLFIESGVTRIKRKQNIFKKYWQYFLAVYSQLDWADLVYVQDPVNSGSPTFLACQLKNKKYFLKIVGDHAWEQGQQKFGVKESLDEFQFKKYNFIIELFRFIQKLVAKKALTIITPSQYLQNVVSQWGVKRDKIKVIYNSVEQVIVNKEKEKLRELYKYQGETICSVGRLVKWKGFNTLVGIMPELLKVNPNFSLRIFGDGPEKGNLEKLIKELNIQDKVKLMGSQAQKKLWEQMAASDYFVLNTGYEGLPHLVIEAMQIGLPVITTRVGGNIEVVENGRNGLLVTYNNKEELISAIVDLWQDQGKRERLTTAAKTTATNYSKTKMIIGVLETLKSFSEI
jgi:glycosyltransferase involved in cell wall biosynthesis